MKTKFLLAVLGCALMASCSVSHIITDDNKQLYQATEAEKIEVFSSDETGKEYVIIGEVIASVDDLSGAKSSVKQLKKEAAKIGADGIINLRLNIAEGFLGNAIQSTGTAIKYIN